jgi:ABC-2 type transport system ATP-binding protein
VPGATPDQVGEIAAQHGLALHELTAHQPSLEETFMELTEGTSQFVAGSITGSIPGPLSKAVA